RRGPRAGVRLRRSHRRRHRRARGLPRSEARDREGAQRRRTDAARVPHLAHGRTCGPRRRVLRAEGDVRALGRKRPDRTVPLLAARARGDVGRRGGRDRGRGEASAERGAAARRAVAATGSGEADGGRVRDARRPRHAAPQITMAEMTYLQAISDGLRTEMRRNDKVFLIGEDVGVYGGAFKVSLGFQEEFGPWRVIDAPLAETAIVGACTGAAM